MAGSDRKRAFMSQWLAGTLAPGDRIVAGVGAVTGPSPYLDTLPVCVGAVALAAPYSRVSPVVVFVTGAFGFGGAVLALGLIGHRKFVYLAVTERELLAVQVRGRHNPVRVLFRTPIDTIRLTTRRGRLLPIRTVWCASAAGGISVGGKTRDRVRLTVRGRRGQLADVLTTVLRQGGAVDAVLPAPAGTRS